MQWFEEVFFQPVKKYLSHDKLIILNGEQMEKF